MYKGERHDNGALARLGALACSAMLYPPTYCVDGLGVHFSRVTGAMRRESYTIYAFVPPLLALKAELFCFASLFFLWTYIYIVNCFFFLLFFFFLYKTLLLRVCNENIKFTNKRCDGEIIQRAFNASSAKQRLHIPSFICAITSIGGKTLYILLFQRLYITAIGATGISRMTLCQRLLYFCIFWHSTIYFGKNWHEKNREESEIKGTLAESKTQLIFIALIDIAICSNYMYNMYERLREYAISFYNFRKSNLANNTLQRVVCIFGSARSKLVAMERYISIAIYIYICMAGIRTSRVRYRAHRLH